MKYLLDNFDSFIDDDVDGEDVDSFEARRVDILTVVQFGDAIGRGKYGIVRKGVYLETNEVVAIKIIQKNEQQPKDIECITVCSMKLLSRIERVSNHVLLAKTSQCDFLKGLLSR